MFANSLFFVAGVCLLQTRSQLPAPELALLVIPAAALAFAASRYASFRAIAQVATKAVLFLAGFFWAALFAHVRLAEALPESLEGIDIELHGSVASLPHNFEQGVRFDFDIERASERAIPSRVSLSWYRSKDGALPEVRAGQRWILVARLKRPHGTYNPHGFDFEAWLLERDIRATGYVREDAANRLLGDSVLSLDRVRERIRENFYSTLQGAPYAGVLVALAIGDQRAIPSEQWEIFTRTGVNHLMSISGLHVTMFSGLVFAFVYFVWLRLPRVNISFPALKAAAIAGALAALAYAALAGFAVPAQRTVYMLTAFAAAAVFSRGASAATTLATALLVVVIFDPWAVLSEGFWLSFGAVSLIVYVTVGRLRRPHWLIAWTRVQWAITLGLIPLMLVLFQQVSIVSPLANALAIPLVSLVVVPLALLATIPLLDFLLFPAHAVIEFSMALLEWLSAAPESVWQQHAPPAWTLLVAALGALLLLAPRGVPGRYAGVAGFIPLFVAQPPPLKDGAFSLTVLDVGQGLAVVVRTQNHSLLYDTGPEYASGSDAGERIVVPFLRGEGVSRFDVLIVSHDDSDHSGGARSVLLATPVHKLESSLANSHPIAAQVGDKSQCSFGQSWEWDGVRFDFLHPREESYKNFMLKDNALSCVLRVSSRFGSALLTADVEESEERELLERAGLGSTVMVVPHHGSKTSSSEAFVRSVNPRFAIFSSGYRNRFGHPRQEVVERYRAIGSEVIRTDRDGAISITFADEAAPRVSTYRKERRRYWHAALE